MLFMISLELQQEIDSIIFTDDEEKKSFLSLQVHQPRWHTRSVPIETSKIKPGKNTPSSIIFH